MLHLLIPKPFPSAAVALFFLATITSCSSSPSDRPELIPVTGLVTLDGEPLEKASVQFTPTDGRSSFGLTDGNGHYKLIFDDGAPGAVSGTHQVRITAGEAVPGKLDEEGQPITRQILPERYNNKTGLTAEVSETSNDINFELHRK